MRMFFFAAMVLTAAEFWADRPAKDWTAEEKQRALTQSPWAKPASAAVDLTKGALSNRRIYMPGPIEERTPTGLPVVRAVVRWESAAPIRETLGTPLPDGAAGRLVLSVTMTGPLVLAEGEEEELLHSTSLQGKGKLPMNPERTWRDEKAGAIYFIFAARDTAKPDDKEWVFETTLGAMPLKAKFAAREMRYLGKPAL